MQFSLMRKLDRYAGSLALILLRPVAMLVRTFRRSENVQCIMVQKYFGIGSIINAVPTIEALRQRWPEARIVFLTFADLKPAFELFQIADHVVTIDNSSIPRFARSLVRALFDLWSLRPDIAIDLEFFSKFSAMMSCLSLAPTRVGFFAYYNLRSPLLTHPVSFNHYRHISRAFLAQAEALGLAVEEPTHLCLPPAAPVFHAQIDSIVGTRRPVIVINVNASAMCRLRIWPVENFVQLADRLASALPQCTLAFIGSKSEANHVQSVIARLGPEATARAINLAGNTTLGGLTALLERAELLITSDSGPAHIAAGFRTPEVVIFGPETPTLYGPLNPRCRTLYKPPYCSPCLHVLDNKQHEDCVDTRCVRAISVDDVFAAALELLSDAAQPAFPAETCNAC